MPTTDFDYILTRNELIESAFRIVGALDPDQNLSSPMLQQGIKALQSLIKSWSNKHLFLWSFNEISFSTVAAQEAYTSELDQSVIGIDKAWVIVSSEYVPLEVISHSRYYDIAAKETNSGRPTHLAFQPTPTPKAFLWPSPDAVYSIKALSIFPLKDFDTAEGTGDLPSRFQRALKYGLAADLIDEYPGPLNERDYLERKANELFREAKIFDMPIETTNEVESLFGRG